MRPGLTDVYPGPQINKAGKLSDNTPAANCFCGLLLMPVPHLAQ